MSSRAASARKRLQDPQPKVSPSVNQAKPFTPTSRITPFISPSVQNQATPFTYTSRTIPFISRIPKLTQTSPVHEHSAYPTRELDLSNEFPQSPPSPEYSRINPQSSDKKLDRIQSSNSTQVLSSSSNSRHLPPRPNPHDTAYQDLPSPRPLPTPLPPPSPNFQSSKRVSTAKVVLTYPEQPVLPSYPPHSPTIYARYPASPPSSSSSSRSISHSPTLTDLPEYRSTYASNLDSPPGRPLSQDSTFNFSCEDSHHGANEYPYQSSSGPPVSLSVQTAALSPYRMFPGAQMSSTSPVTIRTSHGRPRDSSESFSGTSSSMSNGESQPSAPPPSPIFYFPGSRSVARPKVSKINNLQLKIGSKHRPNSQVTFETSPISPTVVLAPLFNRRSDGLLDESASVINDNHRRKIASSARRVPTETFVYPTARSRAQPKLPSGSKRSGNPITRRDVEGRSRFMGMLKFKKQGKAPNPNAIVLDSDATHENPREAQVSDYNVTGNQEQTTRKTKSRRSGSYPLDPYDSILLDNDRHTCKLLSRLNPNGSPSFHDYGNTPPSSVLDLGCGQGHWVLEAAIAWKKSGTKVTGFDLVDISRHLLPLATEQGVSNNIQFVRGNFLKQPLPFANNTFDLVRMSCLALCITSDAWGFVLQQVFRVLMKGGRLELIDDHIFFPYGKVSSLINDTSSIADSVAPKLDIVISPTATRFSDFYGDSVVNPGLRSPLDPSSSSGLHKIEEEVGLKDENANLHELKSRAISPIQSRYNGLLGPTPAEWHRSLVISEDLETLFEHMLLDNFDIQRDPSEFILSFMSTVFGQAREVRTMHLELAPPDSTEYSPTKSLFHCPGLVLWPSIFIPMDRTEIEIHASKHLRTLISCKKYLSEYAIEIAEDQRVDENFISEAIWEYEGFLRHRFNPPEPSSDDSSHSEEYRFETTSIHGSIAESTTSDSLEAMWDIQSQFRQRFAWLPERDQPTDTLENQDDELQPSSLLYPAPLSGDDTCPESSTAAAPAPHEPTHIRTFRVYEATKLDNYILTLDTL